MIPYFPIYTQMPESTKVGTQVDVHSTCLAAEWNESSDVYVVTNLWADTTAAEQSIKTLSKHHQEGDVDVVPEKSLGFMHGKQQIWLLLK